MKGGWSRLRFRWKLWRRDRPFRRGIERFKRNVLAGGEYAIPPDAVLIHMKRNRRIYADADRVWKFYHRSQRKFAREFAAAAHALRQAGVPCPRIDLLNAKLDPRDFNRPALVVMERLKGRRLSLEDFEVPQIQIRLAETLAGMHGILRPDWGIIERNKQRPPGKRPALRGVGGTWSEDLQIVQEWFAQGAIPAGLQSLIPALSALNLPPTVPENGLYSLVCNDPHPGNFIETSDGRLAIIDLDLAEFAHFATDLAHVLIPVVNFRIPEGVESLADFTRNLEAAHSHFLEAYFSRRPEFRAPWESSRETHVLRRIIHMTSGLIKGMKPVYNEYLRRDPVKMTAIVSHNLGVVRHWLEKSG